MSFNKKIFNWSIVLSLLTAYILQSKSSDGFAFNYGYPFAFFTRYDSPIKSSDSIFDSTCLNLLTLVLNVLIIYLVLYLINKIINRKNVT